MNITPLPGELYRHRKGGIYKVLCIAKVEATLELVVIYQSESNDQIWSRPLNEFMDGRFEQVDATEDLGAEVGEPT